MWLCSKHNEYVALPHAKARKLLARFAFEKDKYKKVLQVMAQINDIAASLGSSLSLMHLPSQIPHLILYILFYFQALNPSEYAELLEILAGVLPSLATALIYVHPLPPQLGPLCAPSLSNGRINVVLPIIKLCILCGQGCALSL